MVDFKMQFEVTLQGKLQKRLLQDCKNITFKFSHMEIQRNQRFYRNLTRCRNSGTSKALLLPVPSPQNSGFNHYEMIPLMTTYMNSSP